MNAPAVILEGGSYKHDARDCDPACTPQPRASSVERRESSPLVSTIHWTRTSEALPAYGHHVALWLPTLNLVVRGYRDATIDEVTYRYGCADSPVILAALVVAWAEIPNGALPPPDGGAV